MSKVSFMGMVLGGMLLLGPALALTEKEQAVFQRADRSVQLVETSVAKKKTSARGLQSGFVNSSLKKLQTAREQLSSLPQEPEVRKLLQQLEQLNGELSATASGHQTDAAAAESLLTSPDYDSDREQILALQEIFHKASSLDASSPVFRAPQLSYKIQAIQQDLTSITASGQQFTELSQKWKPVLTGKGGRASFMGQALREATKEQQKFQAAVETFKSQAPTLIESLLQKAQSGSSEAVAAKSYDVFMERAAGPMYNAESLISTLHAVGFSDPALEGRVAQLRTKIAKNEKTLGDALIAKNTGPDDVYQGADRSSIETAVRGAWKARYPDVQVLAIRMPHSWSRDSGWEWDTISDSWRRYDKSAVQVYVAIAHSPTVVQWDWQWVHKFHLNGDRIGVQPFKLDKPTPRTQMLRSRL